MLSNVRAKREGDWSAHLMSSSKMLPYFFITNRTNYSRWMPVYILDMLELPVEIKSAFEKGEFSIRNDISKAYKKTCLGEIYQNHIISLYIRNWKYRIDLSSYHTTQGKNPIFRNIKTNNSGTAKVKIVKNERDPRLFTGKLLIKFQNIL